MDLFKKNIKIQIRTLAGNLLFEYESKDNTIKKTLEKAVKERADLRGADLGEANLGEADLGEADLREADLWGADLWRANLRRVDLWRANLRRANLWGANLRGADLRRADLWGADLRRAEGLKLCWHIHHDQLVENLTEPLKNRIDYIKKEKPKDEIKLRLKLLKKVKCKPENYPTTLEGWEELHKKECPNCPWDSKRQTIFPLKYEK